jgi:NifB/MoaA-like Fe-S oxidoreductase
VKQLNAVEGLTINFAPLRSDYWGQAITVTGLLTGQDLIAGLKGKALGEGLLLPTLMLKEGDTRFLDDKTVEDVSSELGIPIFPVMGVEGLLEQLLKQD